VGSALLVCLVRYSGLVGAHDPVFAHSGLWHNRYSLDIGITASLTWAQSVCVAVQRCGVWCIDLRAVVFGVIGAALTSVLVLYTVRWVESRGSGVRALGSWAFSCLGGQAVL
jgi:hypothetical protein